MTARKTVASALLLLLAGSAAAGLFWRDKMSSRWTARPLKVDADDTDWDDSSAYEEEGFALLARNDAENLYLLVTAHTRETRDVLVGEAKQDVSLWFLDADGKTFRWGARLPYGHRESLTTALRDPAGIDPQPELLRWQGAAASTETWPADLADRLAATGRRPVWELRVPLAKLSLTPERTTALDLSISAPSSARRRAEAPAAEKRPEQAGGRKRDRHEGPAPYEPPGAITLLVTLRLASPPAP